MNSSKKNTSRFNHNAGCRFASYGQKIERTLQLKTNNYSITVITEQTWLQNL